MGLPPGSLINGFADCGSSCRMQVTVQPHDPPVCQTMYGPTTVNLATGGNYNISATDVNNDAIAVTPMEKDQSTVVVASTSQSL